MSALSGDVPREANAVTYQSADQSWPAAVCGATEARMTRPPISARISGKTIEAEDIVAFEIVDPDGRDLPPFEAGAHIDVEAAPGIVRQYSLCNSPDERHRYQIGVLRERDSRGGSVAMHDRVRPGDVVRISAPRNLFRLVPGDHCSLLLAGGIGITPMLSMAESLSGIGAEFSLHYAVRSRARMAFASRIASSSFADHVTTYVDDEPATGSLAVQALLSKHDRRTHVYMCGPGGFIQHVETTALQCGWLPTQLHKEYFAPVVDTSAKQGFTVRIASTGATLVVPGDRSVVDVLLENGFDIPISCEQGICGTCMTGVVGGTPDHRDMFMTETERARNDQFTPCCSRSLTSELVLDL
jgi:vanillate O-demethylase ferredoxin subunit